MATQTVNYDSITASNAIDLTTASLASSATHVAGMPSDIVPNTSALYLDFIVSGLLETAGTITAGNILVYVFTPTDVTSSTFNYPFSTSTELTETTGTLATFTAEQRNRLFLADTIACSTTAQKYALRTFSICTVLGLKVPPLKWGLWVTHNLGSGTLHATEANCWFHWTGIKRDSA